MLESPPDRNATIRSSKAHHLPDTRRALLAESDQSDPAPSPLFGCLNVLPCAGMRSPVDCRDEREARTGWRRCRLAVTSQKEQTLRVASCRSIWLRPPTHGPNSVVRSTDRGVLGIPKRDPERTRPNERLRSALVQRHLLMSLHHYILGSTKTFTIWRNNLEVLQ